MINSSFFSYKFSGFLYLVLGLINCTLRNRIKHSITLEGSIKKLNSKLATVLNNPEIFFSTFNYFSVRIVN